MKIRLLFTGFFLLSFFYYTVNAQTYRIAVIPKGEKKWGYMNLKGEIIVPPQSWLGLPCTRDGTVLTTPTASRTTRKILYDKDGHEITPEIKVKLYSSEWSSAIFGFRGGMLRQRQKGKWGALNSRGKIAVPFVYDELTDFDLGYALGKREKATYKEGKYGSDAQAKMKMSYFVVDTNGTETLIERSDEITYIKHFTEGLAPVELNHKRVGFVDTLGKIVIEPEYITVGYFSGGFAWVRVKNKTLGFINKKGEWIIEPRFAVVKGFDKDAGMALVKKKSSDAYWSYVDTTGNVSYFKKAQKHFGFSEGLALAKLNDKYGYLDNTGEWVILPFLDEGRAFTNGFAAAKLGKRWGIINKKGEWILQPEYKAIGDVILLK